MLIHRGFINDIIAEPANDHLRLIYSDWLDEHGADKQAYIIRNQIKYKGTLIATDEEKECLFKVRQYLCELYTGAFCQNTAPTIDVNLHIDKNFTLYIKRGFLTEVCITFDKFMQVTHSLFCDNPVIYVNITDKRPRRDNFSHLPYVWEKRSHRDLTDEYWMIPKQIFQFLQGRPISRNFCAYASLNAGIKDLNMAASKYGEIIREKSK